MKLGNTTPWIFSLGVHLALAGMGWMALREPPALRVEGRRFDVTATGNRGAAPSPRRAPEAGRMEQASPESESPKETRPNLDEAQEQEPKGPDSTASKGESPTSQPEGQTGSREGGEGAASEGAVSIPGDGSADPYLTGIRAQVERHLRYPVSLQRQGITGEAWIRARILPDGSLDSARVARKSGHTELDELALEAVRAAAPFPPVPESVLRPEIGSSGRPVEVSLPIRFRTQ